MKDLELTIKTLAQAITSLKSMVAEMQVQMEFEEFAEYEDEYEDIVILRIET